MSFNESLNIMPGFSVWVKQNGGIRLAIVKEVDWLTDEFWLMFENGAIEKIHISLVR